MRAHLSGHALFPRKLASKMGIPSFAKHLLSDGREHHSKFSRVLVFIRIFLVWWILTALVYHHTQSTFLRAESGWYLFLSKSPSPVQHNFVHDLLTRSFKGHYAPIALLGEFGTAKVIGTRAGFWKWRQITILALLATTVFYFVRNSALALELTKTKANLSAAGLSAILIFQPQMRDFIAWPIMILQLSWLLFSVVALMSLVQVARHPDKKEWPWFAAGAAYASLHFLGLGIATVAATATGMAGVQWSLRRRTSAHPSTLTAPLSSLLAIAVLHAVVILNFARTDVTPSLTALQPISFVWALLDFIPSFMFATLRSLLSLSRPPPGAGQNLFELSCGIALLLTFGFSLGASLWRLRRQSTADNRTRFILQSFAFISFFTMIALISIRQWHEPSPRGFGDYLVASRYLIPSAFTLTSFLAELLFLAARAPSLFYLLLTSGAGVYAVIINLLFFANIYPEVAPQSMISHGRAWSSIVTMARECRRADLAIPNVPLGALTQEFYDWDLRLFEPLLRADLKASPDSTLQFVAWSAFVNDAPSEYNRAVPSLTEVKKRLKFRNTTSTDFSLIL